MNRKEKIEKQIEAAEENIKYFESRVKDNEDLKSKLEAELEALEKQEEQEWKPKINEKYYYIDLDTMDICWSTWTNSIICDIRLKHKVIFKTEDEAEKYLEYLKAKEKAINEFSKEEWKEESIIKYYFYYSYTNEEFEIDSKLIFRHINEMYFRTKESAQEFINKYEKMIRRELGI